MRQTKRKKKAALDLRAAVERSPYFSTRGLPIERIIPLMTTSLDIANVTPEQLDRCSRWIHENTGEVFYTVLSETDNLTEYKVRFIKGKGFTCTCPAGQSGFHHCSKGTCKHCRWSVAHAAAYKQELAEQSQIEAYVRQGVDRETACRVVYAKPTQYPEAQVKRAQQRNER